MAASAFVILVPEAEACVSALRERFDASAKLGVPAHITVLAPFMPPECITHAVLERVCTALGEVSAFSFDLVEVRRFPDTAYLAPQPPEPFVALTKSLVRSFPAYPPFGGEFETIIPHLTVAHGNGAAAEVAAAELAAIMRAHGRIASSCASVALLENSSGLWRQMHAFNLPRAYNGA
jgi:hypothetical protein